MRSSRRVGTALWAAVFSLALPLSQAHAADDCVEFQGLQHCGLGAAKVSGSEKGVRIDSQEKEPSVKNGVAIYMPPAAAWTAETVSDGAQRNFFTAYAEEVPVSTSSVNASRESTSYSATFTGSGDATTYSVLAYYNGRLQAAVGGIRSGDTGAVGIMVPNPGWTPNCRPRNQTYAQCEASCYANGYSNCNYCNTVCRMTVGFANAQLHSACLWQHTVAEPGVRLPNGQTVRADQIVMQEEITGPSNYPYLNFNRIDVQTTARSTVITGESIIPAGK
ncbi:hypothetical protein BHS09_33595 [Myxococcus xanthus]|uniref:Uncharacterized protein n=1 Tax=Myxococcus xanthus TaxID=34 RepID=A0AAE6KVH6_MYXXA|nr:hypothetical protein [Myxococcus xanthus]QDE71527.1 hypothetical protein BHS09_33595 [Myxococcus xanthus]QDE78808.1 hypothetical protein BHS08_33620 [Myxococcus xanthus]